jgi:hypothetical protein
MVASSVGGMVSPSALAVLRFRALPSPQEGMSLPKASSSGSLGRISLNAASVYSKASRCFSMKASSDMGGRPPIVSITSLVPAKMPAW